MHAQKQRTIDLTIPAIEPLNPSVDRAAFAGLGTTVDLGAGATLSRAGTTPPQFVVVVAGEVIVERVASAPARLTPGQWFGHEALIARAPFSDTSASTVTPTRLWVLSRREFSSLLDRSRAVRRHFEQCCVRGEAQRLSSPGRERPGDDITLSPFARPVWAPAPAP